MTVDPTPPAEGVRPRIRKGVLLANLVEFSPAAVKTLVAQKMQERREIIEKRRAQVRDWIVAALKATGVEASEENIKKLEDLVMYETGGNPNFTNEEYGVYGVTALSEENWHRFSDRGDPFDPVANLIACIEYQLAKHGKLMDFSWLYDIDGKADAEG